MAPNLALSQHLAIRDMILSKSEGDKTLTNKEIARAANCSTRSVRRIRSNLLLFGSTKAPPNSGGRPKSITPLMLTVLLEKLASEPSLRLEDMAAFLNDEFEADVTRFGVGRALKAAGWSRKSTQNVAKERNARLRDEYMHEISCMRSDQLVFIDETGVDRSIGTRNKGWAPRESRPRQVKRFHRGRRVQILPAYTQDGVVHFQAYTGPTDAQVFTEFIEQLLPYCGRWPNPKSVLIMDNASAVIPPSHSPDLNPIEEFFGELKTYIRQVWEDQIDFVKDDFISFLEECVELVGRRKASAEGHFRHAGISLEGTPE
ncbi:transcriptional regulator family: Helix-turn-helix [Purpureocillium lilacinum]|uniref:Transcriptional regulator family: Helix-turn-helix n=1 Tax=Purpureocillium lilacinum TaxID=33203 RepID=A0ABR0BET0_PURLI|nr:transcriptional regulator family: Helix-turn-helix [Purpureocillium lilacinum]